MSLYYQAEPPPVGLDGVTRHRIQAIVFAPSSALTLHIADPREPSSGFDIRSSVKDTAHASVSR